MIIENSIIQNVNFERGDLIFTECGVRYVVKDTAKDNYIVIDLEEGWVCGRHDKLEDIKNFYVIHRVIKGKDIRLSTNVE